jgi:hypothetical protein
VLRRQLDILAPVLAMTLLISVVSYERAAEPAPVHAAR